MSKPNSPAVARCGRDPNKEAYWRECLRRQSRSGLSVRVFCARGGLKEAAFYFWRREIRHRDDLQTGMRAPAPAFVEVHAAPTPTTATSTSGAAVGQAVPLELLLPGGRRLLIHADCDAGLLRRVVAALADVCPAPAAGLSNGEGRPC